MAEKITAGLVKELRERTGAGMMECKKALVEAKGDLKQAEIVIAKSGHKKAAKSASRTAAEGIILALTSEDNSKAVMLEFNCETDFVAKDDNFKNFANDAAKVALANNIANPEELLNHATDSGQTIEDARKNLIAKIGENIQVRRIELIQATASEKVYCYVHMTRIGTLVLLANDNAQLGKDLAMHIAALKPQFISPDEIPEDVKATEKDIFVARAKKSGKPDNMIEKIVSGQLTKHFAEICLTGQPFFKDSDKTIEKLLAENNNKVNKFTRFEVGEGIEVKKMSFAEEVMAQASGKE